MAKEDRPDCRAETMDRAIERMWAPSVPAAEHSCRLKPVAWGQYRGVSAVLLEHATQPKKKSRQGSQESREELAVRQSSPKSWTVAFIPTPETFAPLPTCDEIVVNTQIQWGLPPSLQQLEAQTVVLPLLSPAEVGTTVSADHLLQMATIPLEHKPTALGIPYPLPVSYQFEGAEELVHSPHALFGLLVTIKSAKT